VWNLSHYPIIRRYIAYKNKALLNKLKINLKTSELYDDNLSNSNGLMILQKNPSFKDGIQILSWKSEEKYRVKQQV
jgi:hypothetical protein